jgi:hypothetical protein
MNAPRASYEHIDTGGMHSSSVSAQSMGYPVLEICCCGCHIHSLLALGAMPAVPCGSTGAAAD